MRKLRTLFSAASIVLSTLCPLDAWADNPSDKFLGRWERPGGADPVVFCKDGSCQVSLGEAKDGKWTMIQGTYTVSATGKLTLKAKGAGVTLTETYFFDGDKLTDGVVFFGEERRYWSKTERKESKPTKDP